MGARLFCKTGELSGTDCQVGQEVTIGRSPDNGLVLDAASVADRHARVYFDKEEDCYFLENLANSATALDGIAVQGATRLSDLNIITLADRHDFFFQRTAAGRTHVRTEAPLGAATQITHAQPQDALPPPKFESGDAAPTETSAREPVGEKTVFGQTGSLSLPTFQSVPDPQPSEQPTRSQASESGRPPPSAVLELSLPQGKSGFDLGPGENVIGRAAECEIRIDHPTLSRKHAVLILGPKGLTVNDLGSVNGTFIGEERVQSETGLEPGDSLRFGLIEGRILAK